MLSKNAKRILKAARKSHDKKALYADLEKEYKLSKDEVSSACDQLIENKYADTEYHTYYGAGKIPCGIVLKERGRNYWKDKFANWIDFSFKSIFVPIIVSILTTLLTLLVTHLLGF